MIPLNVQISRDIPVSFFDEISQIIANDEFLTLDRYGHHRNTSRLMHSINVSYLSWKIARRIKCDESVAARAGLLHDFCPYDFREKTPTGEHQAFYHPKAAVENSERFFNINDKEKSIIHSHMFPLGPLPRHREAWIITVVDKICACLEFFHISYALARKNRFVVNG